MKIVNSMLSTLLVAFAITGCAVAVGPGQGAQKISDESLETLQKRFEVDVATRNDVAMQLGVPTSKAVAGDFEIWTYRYAKQAAIGFVFIGVPVGTTKTAFFYFDNETGILKKVNFESHQG
jgi:hypothetical protein